jgi:hypothetical protein
MHLLQFSPVWHQLLAAAAAVPAAEAAAPPSTMPAAEVAAARARALGFLSQVLGGDDVAAEYLLLQLVGRCAHAGQQGGLGKPAWGGWQVIQIVAGHALVSWLGGRNGAAGDCDWLLLLLLAL